MTTHTIETDRAEFVESATRYWAEVAHGDRRRADQHTRAGEKIVGRWHAMGHAEALLCPLLEHDNDEVRYAAAAHLLSLDLAGDLPVAVLQALAQNPVGLVAPTAKLLLRTRRK